jgi:IclR family transcriptional regulator, acetate operon repressor
MAGAATVEKALDVLFHLHAAETAQGLGQIAGALGLAKSSCHRLLASLVEREVVEQDEGGRYRPGLALLALGLGAQRREPVVELARPALESEADELGETVFLVAARRGRLRVLDKCEGSGFLRAAPGIGDVIPGDVTAAGKLYAAHAEAGEAVGAVDAPAAGARIEPAEREAIRRQGYAVNRDAWIDGLSVLGVPIRRRAADGRSRIVAVLALAAASTRFEALGEARIAARLVAAAEEIGRRLDGAFGEAAPRRKRADGRTGERAQSARAERGEIGA